MQVLQPLSRRVLSRLAQAEGFEPDAWLRDDLRIARQLVLHSALGDAVECSPHVLASYEVLGLHPEKVWPAILARRQALVGSCLKAARKKPPQSAKLWPFEAKEARVSGSRLAYNTMDSTAAAYPIPAARGSANPRQYFSRNTLRDLFFALPCKPHLRDTAYRIWVASTAPEGKEIRCFKTMKQYAKAVGKCERTIRYHMRQLEHLFGVCEVHSDGPDSFCQRCRAVALFQLDRRANTSVRRPSTHKLNLERLEHPRREDGLCPACLHAHQSGNECGCEMASRHSYKRLCRCQVAQPIATVTEMPRKPSQPAPERDPDPPLKAEPKPQPERPAAEHHRQLGTRPEQRIRDLRMRVVQEMAELMKSGVPQPEALVTVCANSGVTVEQAEDILKLMHFSPPQPRTNSPPSYRWEKCETCGSDLAQNLGPGPRLICPKCRK